ncbi:MAG: hypothetical protein ABIT37_04350 [Luteolibacter sp.]
MRSRKSIVTVIIALVLIGNWFIRRNPTAPPPPPSVTDTRPSTPAEAPAAATAPPPQEAPPRPHAPEPVTPMPRSEESRAASRRDLENPLVTSYPPSTPPPRQAADSDPELAADLDKVSLMLRDYRTLTGENPVGTNSEIMKTLMGENPKGARLGPPEGQGLNENGELLDRWGTPYFFHQLTSDLMEIRSAGPDRRMWNDDDLIGQ